jgi:MFS family permease
MVVGAYFGDRELHPDCRPAVLRVLNLRLHAGVGATLMSETVPMVLFSSVGGIFADRWKRKRVIISSDWLRGLLLLPLLTVHSTASLWIVYVVAFLGSSVAHFAGPSATPLFHTWCEKTSFPAPTPPSRLADFSRS